MLGLIEAEGLSLDEIDADILSDSLGLSDKDILALMLSDSLGDILAEGLTEADMDKLTEGLSLKLTEGLSLKLILGDTEGLVLGDSESLGTTSSNESRLMPQSPDHPAGEDTAPPPPSDPISSVTDMPMSSPGAASIRPRLFELQPYVA